MAVDEGTQVENGEGGSLWQVVPGLVDQLLAGLARVLRAAGLSRGVRLDEVLEVRDFGTRLSLARDPMDSFKRFCVEHGVGTKCGHSLFASGAEFLAAMADYTKGADGD